MTSVFVSNVKNKGRGVLSRRKIKKGEIIEINEVLVLPRDQYKHLEKIDLVNYCFDWGSGRVALAMGPISFLNHSYLPNAYYEPADKKTKIRIVAIKNIKKGEEITVNYGGDPQSNKELWFDVK